jgi:hypothetical protein
VEIVMATRGFTGRRPAPELADRVPPGQSLTEDFPVLTAGPTPRISLGDWSFTLKSGPRPVKRWTWAEFNTLPQTKMTRDIHCVTKWSKLNTPWTGVLIDDLLADGELEPPTSHTLVHSYDGYSTNVPVADLIGGKAMIATHYEGKPLRQLMVARQGSSCHISTSGNLRNGSMRFSSLSETRLVSGSCVVITSMVIPGESSASRVTDRDGRGHPSTLCSVARGHDRTD